MLNPFYLNARVLKERMVGTKSFNSSVMQLAKLGSYATFGAMSGEVLLFGMAMGVGAIAGTWAGKGMLSGCLPRGPDGLCCS